MSSAERPPRFVRAWHGVLPECDGDHDLRARGPSPWCNPMLHLPRAAIRSHFCGANVKAAPHTTRTRTVRRCALRERAFLRSPRRSTPALTGHDWRAWFNRRPASKQTMEHPDLARSIGRDALAVEVAA
jgi:hypothetical protein